MIKIIIIDIDFQVNHAPIPGQGEAASGRRSTGIRWQEVASERVPVSSILNSRQLLDHKSLSAILVLMFVNDPKIVWSRLHRILRNLSFHEPTRLWIVQSMLSILQRTAMTGPLPGDCKQIPLSWLSITLEAALGCRANMFELSKQADDSHTVTVNSQAAPVVCSHILDCLTSLSRTFNCHFLPGSKYDSSFPFNETDFWDQLIKLDFTSPMHDCKDSKEKVYTVIQPKKNKRDYPLSEVLPILHYSS